MTINLNRQPYFDDFDKNKNFVKILFKPSRPVQVRELNQIQSIQKNQVELLANHLFKSGAKIEGRAPARTKVNYITINPVTADVKAKLIPGTVLRGQTTGIEATIIHIIDEVENISPNTLYINYTKTGTNGITNIFIDGEILDVLDANNIAIKSITVRSNLTYIDAFLNYPFSGKAIIWQISESIYYSHGYFLEVQNALVVGEAYEIGNESYSIGFDVQEEIIDTNDLTYGADLYDNALGYPNFSAPGADRLKINLSLVKRSFDSTQNENFILLVKVEDGTPTYVKSRTDYATLMDTLAERTYDESGNYTVYPLSIKFRDHQKKSDLDSYGLYLPKEENEQDGTRIFGDENKFVAIISPIKAYIKGFLVETIAESKIVLDKARDLAYIPKFYDRFKSLNYILVTLDAGSAFSHNSGTDTNVFTNIPTPLLDSTSAEIGSIMILDVEADPIIDAYRLFFTDVILTDNHTIDQIDKISVDAGGAYFSASLYNDTFSIFNNDQKTLIRELSKTNIYSLKNRETNSLGLDYSIKRILYTTIGPDANTPTVFTPLNGEIFDDYSTSSSFACILDGDGHLIHEFVFDDSNFTGADQITIPFDLVNNIWDEVSFPGAKAVLYQKCIKTNISPKIKYYTNVILNDVPVVNDVITLDAYTDLIKINSITLTYTESLTVVTVDVDVNNFIVFGGQSDYAYKPITLTIINTELSTLLSEHVDAQISINLDFYNHSAVGDYFSIDSYRNIINDTSIIYGYEDVPHYISNDNKDYKLSDCLDFRPKIMDSNKIKVSLPALNGIFSADITYYLPRVDYIVINKDGLIYQKQGISSETPKPPKLAQDDSEMAIMLLKMKPYVYSVQLDIVKKAIENKRYTMRDIGKLEKRIENLEYYTSFTLLEMQTETASIKDVDGNDRYKNGFIADNFQDFQIADIQSSEFRASHDPVYNELRPAAFPYNTDLIFNESESLNWKRIENKILIDYDEESYISQPYSSKSISLNPYFIFERKGIMKLYPDCDNWVDNNYLPELSVTIDTGIQNLLPTEPIVETYWDSWNIMSETNISSTVVTKSDNTQLLQNGGIKISETTNATTTNIYATSQQRSGTEITTTYETRVDEIDLGLRVTDVELMSYARPILVDFVAGNLKPNTKLHVFFDDVKVDDYCMPWDNTASFGDPIYSDANGNTMGIFAIPEKTFFTGQKIFRLTNELNDERDQDTLLTSAETKFWSGGLSLEKQGTTLNVNTFDMYISDEQLTQNRVTVDVTTKTTSKTNTKIIPPPPPPPPPPLTFLDDPLAQTFFNESSCFITSIDLFFDAVAKDDRIWIQLKNTENGYPGSVVLGETICDYRKVNISSDASEVTNIAFPFPIFIEGGKEYAIVVGSFSPETRIFCSLLGKNDLTYPDILIDTQPSIGTLFKGQNNSTWTASQYEDMKLNINRALFKYDNLLIVLQNADAKESITVYEPFETKLGSGYIRVYARNHGLSVNDKVKFNISEGTVITLTQTDTFDLKHLRVGQKIESFNASDVKIGEGIIKSISVITDNSSQITLECTLTDVKGYFITSGYVTSTEYVRAIPNHYIPTISLIRNSDNVLPSLQCGIIRADIDSLKSKEGLTFESTLTQINGFPVSRFDSSLSIVAVDSIDTFIINITDAPLADDTGRCGGTVKFDINRRYELFNVSGAYSAIECGENWTYYGLGHANNGLFDNDDYNRLPGKNFKPYTNVFLKQPNKFVSVTNDNNITDSMKSNLITAEFITNSAYVSPVLDVSTFNVSMVSFRVDYVDETEMNIEPNAVGRYVAETDPINGSEVFKYVSKNIVLKNPAIDLKIILDVYKPAYTDFDVYLKIQPTWDYGTIESKSWIKVESIWKDFISKDLTDFREVEILTNEMMPTLFGIYGSLGEFSSFKIKIIGKARNSANPPLFKRLRAIALS